MERRVSWDMGPWQGHMKTRVWIYLAYVLGVPQSWEAKEKSIPSQEQANTPKELSASWAQWQDKGRGTGRELANTRWDAPGLQKGGPLSRHDEVFFQVIMSMESENSGWGWGPWRTGRLRVLCHPEKQRVLYLWIRDGQKDLMNWETNMENYLKCDIKG
jgi:hypothetical protein